ncbi:protein-L-isoaspartate O-methyltransferase family protein [Palleronia abyssalis]|uniref:Protein-L-isoaspartate O-methyltransferase n=1 Tax=Palleronia abyssalis TaxID=1501240 RepID=A0A2R8BUF8_9RHOB|nr:protein-L-isoaspartate O-methyltransferase [Palleronia abyssalis]SPJ23799.1 Protein-L-isoaspartate O-methyltransferase [Palleronia abyssalis]
MTDFASRRRIMVDTQVRPSDVTRFPIIEAMLDIPREKFVPSRLVEAAYLGENLIIGRGRAILDPRTLAKMLNVLDVGPGDLVLDIAPGFGYSTAVLAHLAQAVVAVESEEPLVSEAESSLAEVGIHNAAIQHGDLTRGAPEHGPYDVIAIQGAVDVLPDAIIEQLAEGGRIACIFWENNLGICRVGMKVDGFISWRYAFNAAAPVLPGFERKAEFTL